MLFFGADFYSMTNTKKNHAAPKNKAGGNEKNLFKFKLILSLLDLNDEIQCVIKRIVDLTELFAECIDISIISLPYYPKLAFLCQNVVSVKHVCSVYA